RWRQQTIESFLSRDHLGDDRLTKGARASILVYNHETTGLRDRSLDRGPIAGDQAHRVNDLGTQTARALCSDTFDELDAIAPRNHSDIRTLANEPRATEASRLRLGSRMTNAHHVLRNEEQRWILFMECRP